MWSHFFIFLLFYHFLCPCVMFFPFHDPFSYSKMLLKLSIKDLLNFFLICMFFHIAGRLGLVRLEFWIAFCF